MADLKISQLPAATTPLAGTEVLPIVQSSATDKVSVANLTAGRAVSAASLTLTTTPLGGASGGTGVSSFTANGIAYASSTSALATNAALTWDGTTLGLLKSGANPILSINRSDATTAGTFTIENGNSAVFVASSTAKPIKVYSNGAESLSITSDLKVTAGNVVQGTAAKGINFTANTPAAGMTSQLLNWYEEGTFTPTNAGDATGVLNNASGQYQRIGNVVKFRIAFGVTTTFTSNVIGGLPFTCSVNTGLTSFSGGSIVLTQSSTNAPIIATPVSGTTNLQFFSSGDRNTSHLPNSLVNVIYRIDGSYFV